MTIYKPYGNAAYKYGNTSRLYGDGSATDDAVHWAIEVDWFNTGSYDGSSEAAYAIGLETSAGRKQFLEVGDNRTFTGVKFNDVGTCRITLDNTTRRFDPYNTSGDLYGNILPGRFIRVRVTYHGETFSIFHGNIARITPYDAEEKNTVVLDCEDGKRWLMNSDANTNEVLVDQYRYTTLRQYMLNGLIPSRFGVMPAQTERPGSEIPYMWTDGTVSGLQFVESVLRISGGMYWFREDGAFYTDIGFDDNLSPIEATTITEANTLKQMATPQPWEEIINVVTDYYYPRIAVNDYIMWESLEKPLLAPSGTYTFFPVATYNGETIPSAIGTATVTIVANTLEDGTGTNLTLFGAVISGADATSCILTVTNFEAVSGYITSIKLTGTVYYADRATETDEDAASIAIYGRHRVVNNSVMNHDGVYYPNINTLIGYVDVQMQARPDIQFDYGLMHQANVTIPKYNIDAEVRRIAHKTHKWLDANGQNVLTTLRLEKYRSYS